MTFQVVPFRAILWLANLCHCDVLVKFGDCFANVLAELEAKPLVKCTIELCDSVKARKCGRAHRLALLSRTLSVITEGIGGCQND